MDVVDIPLKKRLALDVFSRQREIAVRQHTLSCLMWECTLKCDLSCRHCVNNCRRRQDVRDMPMDDFLNVIDSVTPHVDPNSTMIVITGGEPLLRHDLEECGYELNKRGYPWGIVTNGYSMTPARLERLADAGLSAVTVSLDGLEDTHNRMRGSAGSFGRVVETLRLLARKRKDIVYDVATCVTPESIGHIDDIKELLLWAGVERWRIHTVSPVGMGNGGQELLLPPVRFRELLDYIKKLRQEGEINVGYGCDGFLGGYEAEVRDGFHFCRAGINIASVLADGSISSCPNMDREFIQGNIYKDDFMDVWNNRFSACRDRSWTKTGKCGGCKYYKYCLGNGLHLRDGNGDLVMCHLERIREASFCEV